jgi:capsular polysaccharide export protein
MSNIAFIDLGSRLVSYFIEVSKELEPDVKAAFFCSKKKPWSIAKRSGLPTFPTSFSTIASRRVPHKLKQLIINKKILASTPNENKLAKKIDWLYPTLERFLIQQKIDAVFLWNGSGLAASICVMLAQEMHLKTIFGENGYFHNTMQLDPQGVNQAASITRSIANDYLSMELQADKLQQLQAMMQIYRQHARPQYTAPTHKIRPSLPAIVADEWSNLLDRETYKLKRLNSTIPSTLDALPKRYIFIPFQVVQDSQLLLFSPLVGNDMGLLLSSCHAATKQVAEDYKIIVKLHPADINNVDYTALMTRFPDVIFLRDYPSDKLIHSAELIITINSTVGVEALIYGKPVITLGMNFYNVPGVVHHVEALPDLPQAIATALSRSPDETKTLRLLYYLYHCYFTHGSWKNYSGHSIQTVARRISQLVE